MTTTTWLIEWMKTTPTTSTPSQAVITCGWRCSGVDGAHTSTMYGSTTFGAPGSPFIAYANLTQQQVLSWCWESGVDRDAVEAAVMQQIETSKNPPVIQPPLPWV